jgi:cellulose biosynthesis protein BcsQ
VKIRIFHVGLGQEILKYTHMGIYGARANIDIIPGNIKNMLLNNIMDTQLKITLRRSGLANKYDYIIIDPLGTGGSFAQRGFCLGRVGYPG